jgi:hypothetical protein
MNAGRQARSCDLNSHKRVMSFELPRHFPAETKVFRMKTLYLLAAATAVGATAVPASAQQAYPYPYPQPAYPQQAYPGYPQQGYAQPYGTNPVEQIINQLLGNNTQYTVSDRTAVSRCASAALTQAQSQYGSRYGAYGQQGYGNDPRYAKNGYNNAWSQMRVTAITDVQRRQNSSLRVTGLISTGAHAAPYGNAYGYQSQGYVDPRYAQDPRYVQDPRYSQRGQLSFRCNIDYRGAVTGVRVSRANTAYRR